MSNKNVGEWEIQLNMKKTSKKKQPTIMPIKNKTALELRGTKNYHKVELYEMGHKENSHEKVSQSLILLRTHMHIHKSTHTPHTHGHQVFIVSLLLMFV